IPDQYKILSNHKCQTSLMSWRNVGVRSPAMTERCQTKFAEFFSIPNNIIYIGILCTSVAVLLFYRFHFATIVFSYGLGCLACYYAVNSSILLDYVEKLKCHVLGHSADSKLEDAPKKPFFVDELRHQLRYASASLLQRAVKRLVPCALHHYSTQRAAIRLEGPRAVHCVHVAARSRAAELKYLRCLSERLMPIIFAGWALLSLTDVLSEPFALNTLIVLATDAETMAPLPTTPNYKILNPELSDYEKKYLHKEACNIYDTYLKEDSASRVPLQANITEELYELLHGEDSIKSRALYQAARQSHAVLEKILLPKFLHSEESALKAQNIDGQILESLADDSEEMDNVDIMKYLETVAADETHSGQDLSTYKVVLTNVETRLEMDNVDIMKYLETVAADETHSGQHLSTYKVVLTNVETRLRLLQKRLLQTSEMLRTFLTDDGEFSLVVQASTLAANSTDLVNIYQNLRCKHTRHGPRLHSRSGGRGFQQVSQQHVVRRAVLFVKGAPPRPSPARQEEKARAQLLACIPSSAMALLGAGLPAS
ncbi:putative sorting nexin 14, partial [Operophtera brumata]